MAVGHAALISPPLSPAGQKVTFDWRWWWPENIEVFSSDLSSSVLGLKLLLQSCVAAIPIDQSTLSFLKRSVDLALQTTNIKQPESSTTRRVRQSAVADLSDDHHRVQLWSTSGSLKHCSWG